MKLFKSIIKTSETIKDRSQMSRGEMVFHSVYDRINEFIHTIVFNLLKSKKATITLLIIFSLIFCLTVYFIIKQYVQQRNNARKTASKNAYSNRTMKEENYLVPYSSKYAGNTSLVEAFIDSSKVNTSGRLELKIDV